MPAVTCAGQIVVAVRWYLRYGVSYRDVEELLAERGVEVDHVTVYRWVQRFTPLLGDAARFARHSPGDRWFVDETYVKVNGVWRYVYRAVDQYGQVIDVCSPPPGRYSRPPVLHPRHPDAQLLSCVNVVEVQVDLDGRIHPNTAPHGDASPSRLTCPFMTGSPDLRVFQRGHLPLVIGGPTPAAEPLSQCQYFSVIQ